MNIIKSLNTYKPITYYLWLGSQFKDAQGKDCIPKQIWCLIIKLVIERTDLGGSIISHSES